MQTRFLTLVSLSVALTILTPQAAFAYLGPGAGLSAIGAVFAVFAGLLIAIFGFIWYPVKRLRRKRRERLRKHAGSGSGDATGRT